MRIIAGTAKGKKIITPVDDKTRPLKDMVRESIFNIINHSGLSYSRLENSCILDLFSGVGSFGLEAISRGAKKVYFFENYGPSIDLLKKNLVNLSFLEKASLCENDIYNQGNFKGINSKIDIVFLDPPYKENNITIILDYLYQSNLLTSDTLLILHRHKKTKDNFKKNFKIAREEIYGSAKIIFGYFIF